MRTPFYTLIIILFFVGCREKTIIDPCEEQLRPTANIVIKELIGDTAFIADTIFRDNYVRFEAIGNYDSVKWKLGNDPRMFTSSSFVLSFANDLITIPVNFTGYKQPVNNCFPDDLGVYRSVKQLTSVEQLDKATLTKSPMIGRYRGAYTDSPSDTFTVRIEYFDSAKYDVSVMGSKNFYWISNLPKGYQDSTSSFALRYPELRQGNPVEMGYKAFKIDRSRSSCCFGYAWLASDSLYAYSGYAGSNRQFRGKRL